MARVIQVGLGHHRILTHDVKCAHAALMCVTENFSCGEAQLTRKTAWLDVPGLLPFDRVFLFVHAQVAGIMERHRTHVAGALHVVLPAQRVQPGPRPADVLRRNGELRDRSCDVRRWHYSGSGYRTPGDAWLAEAARVQQTAWSAAACSSPASSCRHKTICRSRTSPSSFDISSTPRTPSSPSPPHCTSSIRRWWSRTFARSRAH